MFRSANHMTDRHRGAATARRPVASRPTIEGLEDRQLLSATIAIGTGAGGVPEIDALGADQGVYAQPRGGAWQRLSGTGFYSQVVSDGGTVYALGTDEAVSSYTPAGGWRSLSTTDRFISVAASDGTVYAIGTDQRVYRKPPSGAWRRISGIHGRFTQVAASDGTVYAIGINQELYELPPNGRWANLGGTRDGFTQVAVSDGTVYAIGAGQKLYARPRDGGWRRIGAGPFAQIAAAGGMVFGLGTDQTLRADSPAGGWVPLGAGRFTQIAAAVGSDGTVEVCAPGTDQLSYTISRSSAGGRGSWAIVATPTPSPGLAGPSATSPNGVWTVTLDSQPGVGSGTTFIAEVVNNRTGFSRAISAVSDSPGVDPAVAVSDSGDFVVAYEHINSPWGGVPSPSPAGSGPSEGPTSIDIDATEFFRDDALDAWYEPSREVSDVVVSDHTFHFLGSVSIDGAGNYVVDYLTDSFDSRAQGQTVSQAVNRRGQNGTPVVTG